MPYSRRPLKLAYFSPLPPVPSGISDYSRELLPYLARWAEVHLYIDDYDPSDRELAWNFPVWNYREYPWRRLVYDYDCTVYHLGNSPAHSYLFPYVSRYPGVVVLHDWVLHHFLAGQALEVGKLGIYLREMAYSLGPSGAGQAWNILTGLSPARYFDLPLTERSLDASLGVVAHSDYVKGLVRSVRPGTPVAVVPMGIPLPPNPGSKPALRQRLGLPEEAFLIGSFGLATPYKRIPSVLQALARLVAQGIDAHYVVVGGVAPELDIADIAKALGIGGRVHMTGYVPSEEFNAYLHAVDVCVNLRYPTAGETSASALRCMAAGQATIVSNVDANRELPEDCLIKIPAGAQEEPLLTKALLVLAAEPAARDALGQTARQYIAAHHSLEQTAQSYIAFLEEVVRSPQGLRQPVQIPAAEERGLQQDNLQDIAQHLRSLSIEAHALPWLRPLGEAIADLGLWQPQHREPR